MFYLAKGGLCWQPNIDANQLLAIRASLKRAGFTFIIKDTGISRIEIIAKHNGIVISKLCKFFTNALFECFIECVQYSKQTKIYLRTSKKL